MKNHLLYLLFSLALLSSCNTSKEIIYFQDVEVNSPEAVAPPQDITVQPKDQISIVVSSVSSDSFSIVSACAIEPLSVCVSPVWLAASDWCGERMSVSSP